MGGFWRPGIAVWRWVRNSLPEGCLELFEILAPVDLALAGLVRSLDTSTGQRRCAYLWWIGIGVVAQAFVAYVAKARQKDEAKENENIQDALHKAVRRQHKDTAGALSSLLKSCVTKNYADVRKLQMGFLRLAVEVVSARYDAEAGSELAASWVVPVDGAEPTFETVAHDQERENRSPGKRRAIEASIPGASAAFLTGMIQVVDDTRAESVRSFFEDQPSYRTIVSIPAYVLNIRSGAIYKDREVTGVLNLDCTKAGVLDAKAAEYVTDFAYMLALSERLASEKKG